MSHILWMLSGNARPLARRKARPLLSGRLVKTSRTILTVARPACSQHPADPHQDHGTHQLLALITYQRSPLILDFPDTVPSCPITWIHHTTSSHATGNPTRDAETETTIRSDTYESSGVRRDGWRYQRRDGGCDSVCGVPRDSLGYSRIIKM